MKDLESDHAYSILDVQQVGSQRAVRLRNPWGTKMKTGSPMKKYPTYLNDGVFWMRKDKLDGPNPIKPSFIYTVHISLGATVNIFQ